MLVQKKFKMRRNPISYLKQTFTLIYLSDSKLTTQIINCVLFCKNLMFKSLTFAWETSTRKGNSWGKETKSEK